MIKNAKEAYLLSKANETDTDEFIDSVLLREVQSAAENGDYECIVVDDEFKEMDWNIKVIKRAEELGFEVWEEDIF